VSKSSSQLPSISAILAAAALALSGCKVGPDYVPPDNGVFRGHDAPSAFVEQAQPGTTSTTAPGDSIETLWWSSLNDQTLSDLIARAIGSNNDLRLAIERIAEARAARGIAAGAGLPTLDSRAGYSRSRQSENTEQGRFGNDSSSGRDNYFVGLDAGWELDVFGGIARSVEAAQGDIEALDADRRDVQVILAAEVARNYVDLRGFQQRILVTLGNVRAQADTLGLTDSRFKAGLTSELDVVQARALLETTRAAIPPLEESARAAVHRLRVLMGLPPGSSIDALDGEGPIPVAPSRIAIGLPSELVARRPDIRRAERQLAAQTARIGVATSDLFPKFSLTGSFGLESAQIGSLPQGDSRFWSIGPAVRWPIFQGGRIRANIEVQESRARQALLTYDQTVLIAFEEVENALVSFSRSQARRDSLAEAVAANRRAVELSTELNRAGLADFQRVLDSQTDLAQTEEQQVAGEQAVVQALIRLYKALGGGWQTASPQSQ